MDRGPRASSQVCEPESQVNGTSRDHVLQKHGRATHSRMLRFVTGRVLATQILALVLLFSGNLLASESLENIIKMRSLLDECRIRAKSQVSLRGVSSGLLNHCFLPVKQETALSFKLRSLLGHPGYFLSNTSFRLLTSTRSFHPAVPPFNILSNVSKNLACFM